MYGSNRKILRVNLSEEKITQEEPSEELIKKYLGGRGLASKYLFDELKPGIDPLGPENKLIFMAGLLTGIQHHVAKCPVCENIESKERINQTCSKCQEGKLAGHYVRFPSASRYSVVAKSPLTGLWAQASSGGTWGVDLKKSGFDGIIFEGVSEKPVYLVIDNGKAELKDAKELWGKNVFETTDLIKKKLGKKFNVACIGIAGENLVKYAAIMNDKHRAAGRCGLGAVMGSKKLKAIAVWGNKEMKIADKENFIKLSESLFKFLNESPLRFGMESYGTNMVLDIVNVIGGFPTRNWQTGVCQFSEEINGPALTEKVLVSAKGCFACPVMCGRNSEIRQGPYQGQKGEGPEYESVGTFGGMCYVNNLEAITMAHFLCNDYGLDTISCGSTIAFAMECFEKGYLTPAETGGLEIKFGDEKIIIELIHKIAKREGIGDLLQEGTRRMSQIIGHNSERFAMQVKGLELPAYDSRAAKITGLAFATDNRGGCHINSGYVQGATFIQVPYSLIDDSKIKDVLKENPQEAKIVKDLNDISAVVNSLGFCYFMCLALRATDLSESITYVTGWQLEVPEMRKIGERIFNLERVFNIREGITRKDDTLPKRLLEEPLPEGPAAGQVNNLEILLDAYYELRGWDKETGKPTPEKLKELGLENVIDQIYQGSNKGSDN